MKEIKRKRAEKKFEREVGNEVLANIKGILEQEILEWYSLSCEEDFDDFMADFYSDSWCKFLENNGIELCYEVEPIFDDEKLVAVDIDIFRP
jgi:hypothetical protein